MSEEEDRLDVVARVQTEVEGALIVQRLKECDIDARAVGGFTAGFRAEAPGDVAVVVRHADFDRAAAVLEEFK
jgi:hypothetical protein